MFRDINTSLAGLPNEMVSALSGQGSPYAVNAAIVREDSRESLPAKVGAAISCFISGYKRNVGRNA